MKYRVSKERIDQILKNIESGYLIMGQEEYFDLVIGKSVKGIKMCFDKNYIGCETLTTTFNGENIYDCAIRCGQIKILSIIKEKFKFFFKPTFKEHLLEGLKKLCLNNDIPISNRKKLIIRTHQYILQNTDDKNAINRTIYEILLLLLEKSNVEDRFLEWYFTYFGGFVNCLRQSVKILFYCVKYDKCRFLKDRYRFVSSRSFKKIIDSAYLHTENSEDFIDMIGVKGRVNMLNYFLKKFPKIFNNPALTKVYLKAALNGEIQILEYIDNKFPYIMTLAKDDNNNTPFMLALISNSTAVISYYKNSHFDKIDITNVNSHGKNAYTLACDNFNQFYITNCTNGSAIENDDIIQMNIIKHLDKVYGNNELAPHHSAIYLETIPIGNEILLKYFDDKFKIFQGLTDKSGNTPIMVAAMNGHPNLVQYYNTIADVNINRKNSEGNNLLNCAILGRSTEILNLLENSYNIFQYSKMMEKNSLGQTSFDLAASTKDKNMFIQLESKCTGNITNYHDFFISAGKMNNIGLMEHFIINKDINIYQLNKNGLTPYVIFAGADAKKSLQYLDDIIYDHSVLDICHICPMNIFKSFKEAIFNNSEKTLEYLKNTYLAHYNIDFNNLVKTVYYDIITENVCRGKTVSEKKIRLNCKKLNNVLKLMSISGMNDNDFEKVVKDGIFILMLKYGDIIANPNTSLNAQLLKNHLLVRSCYIDNNKFNTFISNLDQIVKKYNYVLKNNDISKYDILLNKLFECYLPSLNNVNVLKKDEDLKKLVDFHLINISKEINVSNMNITDLVYIYSLVNINTDLMEYFAKKYTDSITVSESMLISVVKLFFNISVSAKDDDAYSQKNAYINKLDIKLGLDHIKQCCETNVQKMVLREIVNRDFFRKLGNNSKSLDIIKIIDSYISFDEDEKLILSGDVKREDILMFKDKEHMESDATDQFKYCEMSMIVFENSIKNNIEEIKKYYFEENKIFNKFISEKTINNFLDLDLDLNDINGFELMTNIVKNNFLIDDKISEICTSVHCKCYRDCVYLEEMPHILNLLYAIEVRLYFMTEKMEMIFQQQKDLTQNFTAWMCHIIKTNNLELFKKYYLPLIEIQLDRTLSESFIINNSIEKNNFILLYSQLILHNNIAFLKIFEEYIVQKQQKEKIIIYKKHREICFNVIHSNNPEKMALFFSGYKFTNNEINYCLQYAIKYFKNKAIRFFNEYKLKQIFREIDNRQANNECIICYCEFEEDDPIIKCFGNHNYHQDCFFEFVNMKYPNNLGNAKCAYCSTDIVPITLRYHCSNVSENDIKENEKNMATEPIVEGTRIS